LRKRLCLEAVRLPTVATDAGSNRHEATPADSWGSSSHRIRRPASSPVATKAPTGRFFVACAIKKKHPKVP
jgi:hypothetical protein